MTKGQKIALIVAGFVALAGGIGYVLFRNSNKGKEGSEDDEKYEDRDENSGGASTNTTTTTTPTAPKPTPSASDILDEKIKLGSKGDGAKAVQTIMNDIATWRKWRGTTRKAPNGTNVTFPLEVEGDFGSQSEGAALLIFDSYKTDRNITRHKARLKWAYTQGYYGKPLNSNLANSSRKSEYKREYDKGAKARK